MKYGTQYIHFEGILEFGNTTERGVIIKYINVYENQSINQSCNW